MSILLTVQKLLGNLRKTIRSCWFLNTYCLPTKNQRQQLVAINNIFFNSPKENLSHSRKIKHEKSKITTPYHRAINFLINHKFTNHLFFR